jgi:hypothetical protein
MVSTCQWSKQIKICETNHSYGVCLAVIQNNIKKLKFTRGIKKPGNADSSRGLADRSNSLCCCTYWQELRVNFIIPLNVPYYICSRKWKTRKWETRQFHIQNVHKITETLRN